MIDRLRRVVALWRARHATRRAPLGPVLFVLAVTLAGAKLVLTIGAFVAPQTMPTAAPGELAWAATPEPAAGPEPAPPSAPPPSAPPSGELARFGAEPFATAPTPVEQQLLVDLSRRRALLDARAEDLRLKEALIRTAAEAFARQVETLERLKIAIDGLMTRYDEREEAEIARLVKIYETMKPKAAAAVFDRLEMPVLLELVTRMKETKASDVMARMRPDRAEAVTRELAHRRRLGELLASRLGEDPRGAR